MNPRVKNFWTWFQARAEKIKHDPRAYANEIADMLHRLHPGLTWEMGSADNQTWDFIVRTEAAELRFLAHEIASSAPPLPGWRFFSWRQPARSIEYKITVDGSETLNLGGCTAEITPDPEFPFLGVIFFSPSFRTMPSEKDQLLGFLALDALLGEKLVEDALDTIEFRSGPPGPVSAGAVRGVVRRLLDEARARPRLQTGKWLLLQGERQGKPVFITLAENPAWNQVGTHPWLVEARIAVKDPNEHGLPGKEELARLQTLEDRLEPAAASHTPVIPWGTVTHDGRRTTGFYVSDPAGLREMMEALAEEAGFSAEVSIEYDPRWRTYRQYRT